MTIRNISWLKHILTWSQILYKEASLSHLLYRITSHIQERQEGVMGVDVIISKVNSKGPNSILELDIDCGILEGRTDKFCSPEKVRVTHSTVRHWTHDVAELFLDVRIFKVPA